MKEKKIGGLSVFKGFESKKTQGRIAYYRHRALKCRFLRFERRWYVEITPSYHFTQDGLKLSKFFEQRLRGIKQLERQNKVHLRQVRLWESVFRQTYQTAPPSTSEAQQKSLFGGDEEAVEDYVEPYPHLTFGELVAFAVTWGIPETAWLPSDVADESDDEPLQRRLFDT